MMRNMFAYVRKVAHKKVKVEPLNEKKAVYRDELTKKQPPRKKAAAVKKTVRFADSEPTILGEDDHNEKKFGMGRCINNGNDNELGSELKGAIRVKVKMTKEEAARLLSKCNEGFLEFKDVARELVSIPVDRVCVMSPCTDNL